MDREERKRRLLERSAKRLQAITGERSDNEPDQVVPNVAEEPMPLQTIAHAPTEPSTQPTLVSKREFKNELHVLSLLLIFTCIVLNFKIYTALGLIAIVTVSNRIVAGKNRVSVWDAVDVAKYLMLYLNIWLLRTLVLHYWVAKIYQVRF